VVQVCRVPEGRIRARPRLKLGEKKIQRFAESHVSTSLPARRLRLKTGSLARHLKESATPLLAIVPRRRAQHRQNTTPSGRIYSCTRDDMDLSRLTAFAGEGYHRHLVNRRKHFVRHAAERKSLINLLAWLTEK
jgi:hypothetical protein